MPPLRSLVPPILLALLGACGAPQTRPPRLTTFDLADPLGTPDAPRRVLFTGVQVAHQAAFERGSYPEAAKDRGVQGDVLVEVWVGTDGAPFRSVAVWGPTELRPAAEAHMLAWRFKPLMEQGRPVPFRFRMLLPFRLRQGEGRPPERFPEGFQF